MFVSCVRSVFLVLLVFCVLLLPSLLVGIYIYVSAPEDKVREFDPRHRRVLKGGKKGSKGS